MSLLDFVRDVGRQVFDSDTEAAGNIKQHLEMHTTEIENIDVTFDDGIAKVCGDCASQAVRDQAILIVGNIKGVERVVADGLTAPDPAPGEASKDAIYEIRRGDTLGGIAKHFYGKASGYTRIFVANRDIIADPNKIYPGQKIRIPLE